MANDIETDFLIDGVSMRNLCRNITTLTGRLRVPAKRGSNSDNPGYNGSRRTPYKPFDSLVLALPMWVNGLEPDGSIPVTSTRRRNFFNNLDELTQILSRDQITMTFVRPDGTSRWIKGEILDVIDISTDAYADPTGMFGVTVECAYPFWTTTEDPVTETFVYTSKDRAKPTPSLDMVLRSLSAGTAPVDDVVLEVVPPSGFTINVAYDVLSAGEYSRVHIADNQEPKSARRVFDGIEETITVDGATGTAITTIRSIGINPRWFALPSTPPGVPPVLTFLPDSVSDDTMIGTTFRVTARNRFLVP